MAKIIARLFCGTILLSGALFAGGADISQTDFIERVINFVMFIALLYYFGADKFKALLNNRKESIVSRLSEIQNRVQEAKKIKESAQKQLSDAKKQAENMVSNAMKESKLIANKFEEQYEIDSKTLEKNAESLMAFEERKAQIEVTESILNDLFNSNEAKLSNEDYVKILNRKVA